jgi:ABC-type spermidine/putrescine transport system permease subunit II
VILAACQSLLLFALALSLPQAFWPAPRGRGGLHFLRVRGWRWSIFVPVVVLLGGWGVGLRHGAGFADLPWFAAWLTTLALGLAVGIAHLILFIWAAFVSPNAQLSRFLNGYLAPSSVITGFALLLVPVGASFLKLVLALTLISFPLLYRWMVHSALAVLHKQILVARSLGAGWSMVLFEIVWPQAAPSVLRASGLAAVWGAGDFAITGIVGGSLNTIPLMMESLIGSYRLESAEWLMLPLLAAGLVLYGLFLGVARYVRD